MRAVLEHGLDRGALPVKLYYCRPVVPLRAAAGRPLPALLPGRRRGDRRRRPGAGRRADPAGRRRLPRPGPDAGAAAAQLARRRRLPAGLPGRAAGLPARPGPGRGRPGPGSSSTRCGCSTTSAPRCSAQLADAPAIGDYLCDDCQAHYDAVRELPRRARRRLRGRPEAGARPRLLHPHHLRVRARRPRLAVRVGGGGRYDGLVERDRRPGAARRSAGRSGSTAPCSRWRPRACAVADAARVEVFVGADRRGGRRRRCSASSAELRAAGVAARPRLRRPRAQGRDEAAPTAPAPATPCRRRARPGRAASPS